MLQDKRGKMAKKSTREGIEALRQYPHLFTAQPPGTLSTNPNSLGSYVI